MRLIKLAVLSIIFLFLVATAISLTIPSHIRISKAVNLKAPKDSVLHWVEDTVQWTRWHPAFQQSPAGRTFAAIRITSVHTSDSLVTFQMQQGSKQPVINGFALHQVEGADSLTLQWYLDFQLKWYPWQKFGSMFYENTYGVMMQQGLTNMKQLSR